MKWQKYFIVIILVHLFFFQTTLLKGQSTFTVTNLNDAGAGSLREAMINANTNPGLDLIQFDLGEGGPFDINVYSNLPVITEAVIIDGFSQQNSQPPTENDPAVYIVVIAGSFDDYGTHYGFEISPSASNCTIKGLTIQNFYAGINIAGSNNKIEGNRFVNNQLDGILVTGANNFIGGSTPDKRNVVIYNGNGIDIFPDAAGNIIERNYIGVNDDGITAASNNSDGLAIGSSYNHIVNNVISGQGDGNGILIMAWDERIPENNVIYGNKIGTDKTGTTAISNGQGISIHNSRNNIVGGTGAGEGNLISGNNYCGILIDGTLDYYGIPVALGNTIKGNLIGTASDGVSELGNGNSGINIALGSNNTVGGRIPGEENIIAFNHWAGILLADGKGNSFIGNSIFQNYSLWEHPGLGIDILPEGVNPIDYDDSDEGANDLINFPFIKSAMTSSNELIIEGFMNYPNPETITIDFYANYSDYPNRDESLYGEGYFYLGNCSPDDNGNFNVSLAPVPVGTYITAIATDENNSSSEFALNIETLGIGNYGPGLGGTNDIYSYKITNGKFSRITNLNSGDEYNPSWSPDDKEIIYDFVDTGINFLYVTNVNTGKTERYQFTENGNDAIFTPNGEAILFDNWEKIYLLEKNGMLPQLLIEDAKNVSLSPDGTRIVFYRPSDFSILTCELNNPAETSFITTVSGDLFSGPHPRWGNDGWIYYENNGIYKIKVKNNGHPDGDPIPLLLNDLYKYGYPNLSDDGTNLVIASNFENEDPSDYDIWTLNPNGNNLTYLAGFQGTGDYDPMFCTDGKYVAFSGYTEITLPKENNLQNVNDNIVKDFELHQNFPNPFNPATVIGYEIRKKENVKITILNSIGEEIATILDEEKQPGYYRVKFNGSHLSSGVYFYRLTAGNYTAVRKMVLMK